MKSIISLDALDLGDSHRLARKIHNAICSYHLLRGRAPSTVCVHPDDMEHVLVGAVENVIFPKGVALLSDEAVRRGTVHLTSESRSSIGLARWRPATAVGEDGRLLQHALRTN